MDFNTFLENFDALAEATSGIPKLRALILDLAVRGKLVPQNPEDEPAELLRNQIVVEKQNLEKSKKIAKQRSLTPVQDDEQPYLLPSNWCWCRWNDVVLHIGDIDHKMPTEVSEGIPYVSPRDFKEENTIDFKGAKKISYEDFERLKRKVQPTKGDIIFPRYGTIGENRLVEVDMDFLASYSCAVIKNFNGYIEPKYSYYYSISKLVKSEIERYTNKTTQANVGIQSIQNFIYPLPPLAEQKRIVEKVDELMALCDRYEAAKQTRDKLRQKLRGSAIASLMNAETDEALDAAWAIMRDNWHNLSQHPEDVDGLRQVVIQLAVEGKLVPQDSTDEPASFVIKRALEKRKTLTIAKKISKREPQPPLEEEEIPFELPSGWECIRFGEITDAVSGVTKGRKLAGRETASYPYLRVANVQRWQLDLEVMKEIEIPVEELDKYRLQSGDVLLTEGGDWDKLGRSAIWQGEIEDCIHQNHVFRARPLDHGLLPEWAVMFTNSPVGRRYFESAAKRTTNLASINMTQLRFCPFPVPPEEEQKRIVAKVNELMKLCDQLEASLRQRQQRAESLAASAISHLII